MLNTSSPVHLPNIEQLSYMIIIIRDFPLLFKEIHLFPPMYIFPPFAHQLKYSHEYIAGIFFNLICF